MQLQLLTVEFVDHRACGTGIHNQGVTPVMNHPDVVVREGRDGFQCHDHSHAVYRHDALVEDTGRQPPSETDCRVLAFGQVRDAIVVTDDIGMHLLAEDFDISIWHGWQLLAKMKSAKLVSNELVREIYEALESNGDLTQTWVDARHTEFARIFGPHRE